MSQGNFFAVGAAEFERACDLGLRPAVALLVMARGTLKDQATTSWSAQAIFDNTGMAWRRAKEAIQALIEAKIVTQLKAGKMPRYKLSKPKDTDGFIWLPNEIVDGAGNEVPPVRRLRERGDAFLFRKFIQLYGAQDLTADGGLPRTLVRSVYSREKICPVGAFVVYGFKHETTSCSAVGVLAECNGQEDDDGNKGGWIVLTPLHSMGLIEEGRYMTESEDHESEILYPMNADTEEATYGLVPFFDLNGGAGFARKIEIYHPLVGIALRDLNAPTLIGVFRLVYRPKTAKTTVWYASEQGLTERFVQGMNMMLGLSDDVDINGFQGSSMEIKGYQ
ncbi:hypothetical protein [Pseudomonas sp. BP8]|uniref:hypothetical protein n=1 Tax=Pseudomonas sp. BP8 TaxID=2817864 RepID=UPI001AE2D9CC|nr:hypothetical protein [Pseudomonas sp. BP8]MBP2259376.1 hypothetical protein [Pseudomonas sp. BP8]HDS1734138.1 hypothetical protein [Pseudomonas putida]